jgi:hypothetical protein
MTQNYSGSSTSITVLAIIIVVNIGICIALVLSLMAAIPAIQLYVLAAVELAAVALAYYYSRTVVDEGVGIRPLAH